MSAATSPTVAFRPASKLFQEEATRAFEDRRHLLDFLVSLHKSGALPHHPPASSCLVCLKIGACGGVPPFVDEGTPGGQR